MNDLISRQAAIEAVSNMLRRKFGIGGDLAEITLAELPSAQPDEEKISDTLYNIYRNTSPHTSAEGVAAVKYYIREIYREIFGEEGPKWLKK